MEPQWIKNCRHTWKRMMRGSFSSHHINTSLKNGQLVSMLAISSHDLPVSAHCSWLCLFWRQTNKYLQRLSRSQHASIFLNAKMSIIWQYWRDFLRAFLPLTFLLSLRQTKSYISSVYAQEASESDCCDSDFTHKILIVHFSHHIFFKI
jgi:hypothetical protein